MSNMQIILSVSGFVITLLGINLVVFLRFTWRHGEWVGRVTTLLEEHQTDLTQHDKRISKSERDISHLKGALGA